MGIFWTVLPYLLNLYWGQVERQMASHNLWIGQEIYVSYYAHAFHGRRTASGEIYDMHTFTCASPSLPFGTTLVLQKDDNLLMVTVNDRGPYAVDDAGMAIFPLRPHPIRRLDLSYAAFEFLAGNHSEGVTKVKIVGVRFP